MLSDRGDEIKKQQRFVVIRIFVNQFTIEHSTIVSTHIRSINYIRLSNYRSLFYIKRIINLIAINTNRVEQVNDLIARVIE